MELHADVPFVTRAGQVARAIAEDVKGLEVGDRLPTIAEYARRYKVGIGTVQKALDALQGHGCVRLEAHGQRGTFLRAIDCVRLWTLQGRRAIVGVMPLPYSRRYEGLATGLRAVAEAAGLSILLAFVRGARTRLEGLAVLRYDFVVMSRFAVECAISEGWDLQIALDFGPHSYVQDHALLFGPGHGPTIQPGDRIGVDNSSFDQSTLTRYECNGRQIELVEIGYMQVVEALTTGRIQAAVWASDPLERPTSAITHAPLSSDAARSVSPRDTTAVIVVRTNDAGMVRLLKEAISVETVRRIQEDVIAGRRMPSY